MIYVIQEHRARRLHWDLRLEKDGVLKSWALPKTPPLETGIKRLAVQVEDHPAGYEKFEGRIPEGDYGAGTVKIWDRGSYSEMDWKETKIVINISGDKLSGEYCLIKLKDKSSRRPGRDKSSRRPERDIKNWLFFRK